MLKRILSGAILRYHRFWNFGVDADFLVKVINSSETSDQAYTALVWAERVMLKNGCTVVQIKKLNKCLKEQKEIALKGYYDNKDTHRGRA